ncbi:MAG: hypothetical protein ACJ8GN_30205 [Longimicrobiaceae bacterium]
MSPARHAFTVARGRGARPLGGPGEGDARRTRYERLARVSLRHAYYRASGGACPGFAARPTAWTAVLMRRLGLLFRAEEAGFSVLYDRLRQRELLDFLQRQRDPDTHEAWTRLCFTLSSRNPAFVNITELPIDTNPLQRNLYLTNRQAHLSDDDGGEVLLSRGDRVSGAELVAVTGGQLEEAVDDRVDRVRVLTVSGAEVICKPRCVRPDAAALKEPYRLYCADAASPPDEGVCSDRLYFDLSVLPEEKYTVETVWCDPDRSPATAEFLYTASYPVPLCFVELLFSDPAAAASPPAGEASPPDGGVYPVLDLGGPGQQVVPVDYVVPFAARRTWWSYYVFARPPRGERGELAIRQVRDGRGPRAAFLGPCCVQMAGGGTAWRFVSTRPLPLEERSPLHLQLVWRRAGSAREDVLVARLPVASGEQVLPLDGGQACEQAWKSLCQPPGLRCRRLLRSLCRGASPPDPRNFSDIYVHV